MARITKEQWEEARAKREAGESLSDVAKWLGVDRALVSRKAAKEGWGDGVDLEAAIQKKVTEKVMQKVTGRDLKKIADSVDAIALKRADVEIRHQQEWEEHKQLVDSAIANQDFESAKLAKITAETLKIRQEGERKAWRLDTSAPQIQQTTSTTVYSISPQEYEERAKKIVNEV